MKNVILSDISLREGSKSTNHVLSFREKVEMLKLLERTGVNAIELPSIKNVKTDGLFLKMAVDILANSTMVCQLELNEQNIEDTWHCVNNAKNIVLQIAVPTSVVQMEYFCHKKPPQVLEMTSQLIKKAKEYCPNVEFVAIDATRSDSEFLKQMIEAAIASGSSQITVCDSAGMMMPDEMAKFIDDLYQAIPALSQVSLGVEIYSKLNMAEACAFTALSKGAIVLKTMANSHEYPNLDYMVHLLAEKGDRYGLATNIKTTELTRSVSKLANLQQTQRNTKSPFDFGVSNDKSNVTFDKNDDLNAIAQAAIKLGYELSEEDNARVYEAFANIASKKDFVSSRELEAIIASTALQVPATYKIDNYVINSGNLITSTATVCLQKNGELLQGISLGDGPIDASFLAIEKITGHHYELEDFQIQSVTEGREAMGSALVKLRYNGKIYAGTGISTDIIGSSIRAYVSALNKIAYEEDNR